MVSWTGGLLVLAWERHLETDHIDLCLSLNVCLLLGRHTISKRNVLHGLPKVMIVSLIFMECGVRSYNYKIPFCWLKQTSEVKDTPPPPPFPCEVVPKDFGVTSLTVSLPDGG